MELQDGSRPAVGSGVRLVAPRPHEPIDGSFAVAEDAAAGMAGGRVAGVCKPPGIAGRHEDFGVNAAKGLGVRILNLGTMFSHSRLFLTVRD